jgi:hypothetical protein
MRFRVEGLEFRSRAQFPVALPCCVQRAKLAGDLVWACACARARACACVRACVLVCVCVCARARACTRACVCVQPHAQRRRGLRKWTRMHFCRTCIARPRLALPRARQSPAVVTAAQSAGKREERHLRRSILHAQQNKTPATNARARRIMHAYAESGRDGRVNSVAAHRENVPSVR